MSIKLCIMSPVNCLTTFSDEGDMLLALPHIVQKSTEYKEYYNMSDKRIILDSGVIELGLPMNYEKLMKIGEKIGALEIALPDYLHDSVNTITSAKNIYRKYRDTEIIKKYRYMGIVQGNNLNDWLKCFEQLASIEIISTIGIGIYSVNHVFSSITKKMDCFSNGSLSSMGVIPYIYRV